MSPSHPRSERVPRMTGIRGWSLTLLLGACCLFWCGCAHSPSSAPSTSSGQGLPPAESYLRVWRTNETSTAMQILMRRMGPARGKGPTVWLVGVSHLGEPGYYQEIQRLLDAQTCVLYEGVRPDDSSPSLSQRPQIQREVEETGGIQSSMAKALGLVFQLSAIDYQRPHFLNSDLSVREMQELIAHESSSQKARAAEKQKGKEKKAADEDGEDVDASAEFAVLMSALDGNSVFNWVANIALGIVHSSSKLQGMARLMIIEVTGAIGGDFEKLGHLNPGLRTLLKVLIEARNERVVDDLLAVTKQGRNGRTSVAIFYGAAHMNDMEARVREHLKLVAWEDRWLTAFEVDTVKAGLTPADQKMIRTMVEWQMKQLE